MARAAYSDFAATLNCSLALLRLDDATRGNAGRTDFEIYPITLRDRLARQPVDKEARLSYLDATMEVFFKPMSLFAESPVWALFVGVGLIGCYFLRRAVLKRRSFVRRDAFAVGSALLWVAYFPYELCMNAWERSVIAPIRLDLILLTPMLYAAAVTSLIATVRLSRDAQAST